MNYDEAVLHFLRGRPFAPVCWGRLYKRECIATVRFDKTMRIAEDGKFFLDAIEHSRNVYFSAERSYFYFVREGSVVHSGFNEKYYDELRFCEELAAHYKGREQLGPAAEMKCYQYIVRLLRMPDLPTADYNSLLPKAKRYYRDVKSRLSAKERLKFWLLSNEAPRGFYLKVKK